MRKLISSFRRDGGENSIMQTITIAVSAILVASGLATAPGLINNARDNNARGDLANLAYAQESILGDLGAYAKTLGAIANSSDKKVKLSGDNSVNVVSGTDCYALFGLSQSGTTFYRTSVSAQTFPIVGTWPTAKPSGYPKNCAWPSSSVEATPPSMTNYAPNPSFELAGGKTTIRKNYARDPLFTVGTNWGSYFNPTASRATDEFHSAPYSRKIVTNRTDQIGGTIVTQNEYLQGGQNYASIWMKADAGSTWVPSFRAQISGQPGYLEGPGGYTVTATGDWQQLKLDFVLPTAEYTMIGIQVKQPSLRVGTTAYFDDVEILGNQSPAPSMFDGSTPASGDFTYEWSGAVAESASSQKANGFDNVSRVFVAPYQVKGTKGSGENALGVTRVANGDGYVSIRMPGSGKPNTTYTVAYTIWADKDVPLEGRSALQEDGGALRTAFNVIPTGTKTVTSTPERIVVTGTTPANWSNDMRLVLRTGAGIGDTVYYDDFVVTEGAYSGAYFDGNGFGNKWNGTPNNSTSYGRPSGE